MGRDAGTAYDWRTRVLSLAAGLALWELIGRLGNTPLLPPFSSVARALLALIQSGQILGNLSISLVNLAIGVVVAAVLGLAAGIAMGRSRYVALVAQPYLDALLAAPSLAFVPVLYTLFGATRATQIGSVFLHAVFVIAATTLAGLRTPNAALLSMAASFGATDRQLFWKVRWPEARPFIMSGLRVGVLFGVKGMINGETFIALTGLGALVRLYGGRFEADKLLAILVVIAGVALMCSWLVDAAVRRPARSA